MEQDIIDIKNEKTISIVSEEDIKNKIYNIRGVDVMLDSEISATK